MKSNKLKTIIFSFIPLLILLIVTELVLRVIYFQRNNNEPFAIIALIKKINNRKNDDGTFTAYRYVRLKEHLPNQNLSIKPNLGDIKDSNKLLNKDYPFLTDANGFMLPQVEYKDANFSLVFMGGSTTECSFVKGDKRFPYLVGKFLEKNTTKKINVYNSGVSGNHTYHAIDLLINKIIPMHPKYVVLMECINDWTTLLFEGTYWNDNPTRSLIIDPNKLVTINKDEWAHLRGKKLVMNRAFIIDEFSKAQNTFIAICKTNNIEPILMTQANRYKNIADEDIYENLKNKLLPFGLTYDDVRLLNIDMNEEIRRNAIKNNVVLIDLEKEIPKSIEFMDDIVHYNDRGSMMAAYIISKELIKFIK